MANILHHIKRIWQRDINVYFVSGMCYNGKVFDQIILPKGYNKICIEWIIPRADENIDEYVRSMAQNINQRRPFILVGYSLGGVIVQEMNKILSPKKTIIISSIKNEEEAPTLFRFARYSNFLEYTPKRIYESANFIARTFNRLVCDAPFEEVQDYLTMVNPVYVRWAALQITNWKSDTIYPNLYHIHGTKDQIFPIEYIKYVYPVPGGDHLMILRKTKEVNLFLNFILSKK